MSSPLELLQEFERELTYRGVDYRKSQFQSLRTAIEAQAAELAQARARIGRLEDALRRMDSMHELMMRDANHGASCYQNGTIREMNEAPIQAAKALNESPAQSLAAMRAEALRSAASAMQLEFDANHLFIMADRIEREAKEKT